MDTWINRHQNYHNLQKYTNVQGWEPQSYRVATHTMDHQIKIYYELF